MEQTKALMRLLEAAELLGMVEELSSHPREPMSPAVRAGIRVTLKHIRDTVLSSHDALAAELVARASGRGGGLREPSATGDGAEIKGGSPNERPQFARRDLRSAIEKFIEPEGSNRKED